MNRAQVLRRRIRGLTWLFIVALVVSGATAIPLQLEVDALVGLISGPQSAQDPAPADPPAWTP